MVIILKQKSELTVGKAGVHVFLPVEEVGELHVVDETIPVGITVVEELI